MGFYKHLPELRTVMGNVVKPESRSQLGQRNKNKTT